VVKESLLRRHTEPVEISAAARAGVRVEGCAGFCGLEGANLRDGEPAGIDRNPVVRNRQVAGDVIERSKPASDLQLRRA
jgi:hypothetical protein